MRNECLLYLFLGAITVVSTPASAGTIDYTYDALGRVVRVVYVNGAVKTTVYYFYDEAGNRTTRIANSSTS